MATIWVPIIGDGSDDNPYRPDVPAAVSWSTDDGIPVNLADPDRGRPIGKYANIIVADDDVEKCPARIAEKAVPEADRLTVGMIRACRDNYGGNAEAFFEALPELFPDLHKRVIKDVLIRAVHRGLSAEKAEAIRARLNLPTSETQENPG